MSKKIGFVVISTLFLVIALFSAPLTFAQIHWDYCKVSAYGNNLEVMETGTIRYFDFFVVAPPSGSEITNTYEVNDYGGGENYTGVLSIGSQVRIRYDEFSPISNVIDSASEANHYIIYFEGEVYTLRIDSVHIPEFSPILIIPMFIAATLLALAYRRKRTSQNQTTG